jgi:Zn-dependent oligopeptidase
MKVTLTELEVAAKALEVTVTYEDLKTTKGGSCRVMETRRIIINKHLHANEKINILARELGRFELGGIDLSESARKKIQQESDQAAETMKLSA